VRVAFDRWPATRERYEAWWAGELGRPIVNLAVIESEDDTARRVGPAPDLHYTRFTGTYREDTPTERIVDRYDWELARRRFVADGFPSAWPNFGAGVLAALLGCRMKAGEETIWFEPESTVPISELDFTGQAAGEPARPAGEPARAPAGAVHERILAFYRAAKEAWGGGVQLGMTDLGGTLDVLQSFLPSAQLALELYDNPDEVVRLTGEIHNAWWRHFEIYDATVHDTNPGYTAWTPLLSQRSYYMLQCDFAYLIGPDMFEQFVLPELTASCARLERPFYHLDGTGQLAHLDRILEIPSLAGVQWIPGEGSEDVRQWPEVYRKIRDAGKLIQLFADQSPAGVAVLDVLAEQLGSLENVALIGTVEAGPEEEVAHAVLDRHGVPW
jgi:5-methyltetrahydrofolate--homocysteine methyltransferase